MFQKIPWGRSVSVNNLTVANGDSGQVYLKLEMQSGDEILIVGKRIREEPVNEHPL